MGRFILNLIMIENELKELLQVQDVQRQLDSLETMVIKSYLSSLDIVEIDLSQFPPDNTLKGWITWLQPYLPNGQI